MISIIKDHNLTYPDNADYYSPCVEYPEYVLGHFSEQPNQVYDNVRRIFAQAGFDSGQYGTAAWNPLSKFIKLGQQIFVLCNFVYQRRDGENERDFSGKCIHGSVLRAVVDYILLACGHAGKVYIGNAPLQGCSWDSVLRDTGAARVAEFYQQCGLPVEAVDLRLLVAERGRFGSISHVEMRDERNGVRVDLGKDSLLADIAQPNTHFRVLDYNPIRTESFHRDSRHVYVINRKILESDVIFSIPKLKTHEKVGITCTIKGCVGSAGSKDCLAHHRFGPPCQGGDEYPSDIIGVRRFLSLLHDKIQRMPMEDTAGQFLRIMDRVVRHIGRPFLPGAGGGWSGNDTCWRMAVDLARIIFYSTSDGKMQNRPIRKHLAMIDGIRGGEGEGPLAPKAVDSGLLIFGDNPVPVDYVAAILMGYEPQSLPIVSQATKLNHYPLLEKQIEDECIFFNGRDIGLEDLKKKVSYRYRPPRGWRGTL